MTPFDYLSVLLSIVLGLSITQLLAGFAALVRARSKVVFYWPLLVQMSALFLINVQLWWSLFSLHDLAQWTFAGFFIVLLQPVTLYLMSAFITPTLDPQEIIDLRAFYYQEKPWFFGAAVAAVMVSLAKIFLVINGAPSGIDLAAHGVFIVLASIGLLSSRDIVHKVLAPTVLIIYTAYIAALFVTLPGH